MTFSINVTLDGCVDHQEGIADDETHTFFTRLMDEGGAIESRREGRLRKQEFSWGLALGDVSELPSDGGSGTRITVTLADEAPDIDFGEVTAQADHWRRAHPGLQLRVSGNNANAL